MTQNRAMHVALVLSALFHLSMVTVFSIGVWFEVEPIHYYEFDILDYSALRRAHAEPPESSSPSSLPALKVPSADSLFGKTEPASPSPTSWSVASSYETDPFADLPPIQPPTVMFDNLERLRLRERSLEVRSRHHALAHEAPQDSWARFGKEVAELRGALSRLPFFDKPDDPQEIPGRTRVSIPAEGYEAYIEWMSEPMNREVLFSPPIEALLRLSPGSLVAPLDFTFRVGVDGRVRDVIAPDADLAGVDTDLIVNVSRVLLADYRFEPLNSTEQRDQFGTFVIVPVETAAP